MFAGLVWQLVVFGEWGQPQSFVARNGSQEQRAQLLELLRADLQRDEALGISPGFGPYH